MKSALAPTRQTKHPLGDNVALNLGGAALDSVTARSQKMLLPAAALDRIGRTFDQLAGRSLQFDHELLHPLIQLRPGQLRNRSLGAGVPTPENLRERAVGGEAEHLEF